MFHGMAEFNMMCLFFDAIVFWENLEKSPLSVITETFLDYNYRCRILGFTSNVKEKRKQPVTCGYKKMYSVSYLLLL